MKAAGKTPLGRSFERENTLAVAWLQAMAVRVFPLPFIPPSTLPLTAGTIVSRVTGADLAPILSRCVVRFSLGGAAIATRASYKRGDRAPFSTP